MNSAPEKPPTGDAGRGRDDAAPRPWTRTVAGYVITVASGSLDRVEAIARASAPAHRYAIITDDTVRRLYVERVVAQFGSASVTVLSVSPGEAHKTRESWARLTDDLLSAGHGRDSAIIALGGGVVGDLAGFVAATYMRGIPFVQVPTTLLAMLDASVGGKTAVDTPAGKNLVGAFHRPAAVIVDPAVLGTLPARELRGGLAEAIKHGMIADAAYLDLIRHSLATLLGAEGHRSRLMAELITRSIEIKSDVVEGDEREAGRRRILNFGHTLGHAIEALSGYTLLHGEAVAIGMALEAELAERAGIAGRGTAAGLREVLRNADLPTERPRSIDADRVLELARGDKKTRAGVIEMALPLAVGRMAGEERGWTVDVGEDLIREVVEERAGP